MKVFTMVKGEVDIVKDWVLYHGEMFGYSNLYIIDNYSRDGTWETLVNLKKQYNINIMRLPDYKKKGDYMTILLRTIGRGQMVFPIDIDEFIVHYNEKNNTISCDKDSIIKHIISLKFRSLPFYKMNYIQAKNFSPHGYDRATIDVKYGKYDNRGGHAKTFFNSGLFKGVIDHGNHYMSHNYVLSELCLVHFHQRNLDQIKKKVFNNVKGLGYPPFDLQGLRQLRARGHQIAGFHHIEKQIAILEKRFTLDMDKKEANDISLNPLNELIQKLN
jgi:hypothetical protein